MWDKLELTVHQYRLSEQESGKESGKESAKALVEAEMATATKLRKSSVLSVFSNPRRSVASPERRRSHKHDEVAPGRRGSVNGGRQVLTSRKASMISGEIEAPPTNRRVLTHLPPARPLPAASAHSDSAELVARGEVRETLTEPSCFLSIAVLPARQESDDTPSATEAASGVIVDEGSDRTSERAFEARETMTEPSSYAPLMRSAAPARSRETDAATDGAVGRAEGEERTTMTAVDAPHEAAAVFETVTASVTTTLGELTNRISRRVTFLQRVADAPADDELAA